MEMNDKQLSVKDLKEIIRWVESKISSLFVEYEENAYSQAIVTDKTKWDSRYYHTQEVYAGMNFSKKRIMHMIDVLEYIRS